ncbi:hypothetical protein O181_073024 [Austropuccinia psidii MF-1]|uniref:Uncharacterized protein n=1 Tax=Austropuccinia psidii MF-1 TaxID=1389203 RepID=A0A9Q3F5W2_9BASI|nr:hypothetical protein [Austropuccinia psidii MF-1]
MAKSLKRHFLTSEAFQNPNFIHTLLTSPQKTFGPFQPSITKSAICGVIHHNASFSGSNPMVEIPNVYFNFSTGHQGSRASVIISNTNDAIKQSMVTLTHSIPPREKWLFILKGYSRGSSKTMLQGSMLHQSNLETQFIQFSLNSSRPVFSIHTPWEDHSPQFISQSARYTLHQAVNTASRIQYRPAVSLKESGSQPFTYTSLLLPWGIFPQLINIL